VFVVDKHNRSQSAQVQGVRYGRDWVVLKLAGCESISEAEKLRGGKIGVPLSEAIPLPQGCYFQFQIMGLKVFTEEQAYLGTVQEIFPTGSNDVYVVRDGRREVLIPAISEVIKQIDLENKCMVIHLMEGLM